MDWNCKISDERLSEYLDGKLSPAECVRVRGAQRELRELHSTGRPGRRFVGQLHQLRRSSKSRRIWSRGFSTRRIGPRAKGGWKKWFSWVPILWQPRFAMGIITVAASLTIVIHSTGITPAKLKRADLSPANIFRSANRQVHLTYARSAKFVNDLRVVYEIQSRLQPAPEPSPNSAPAPEQKQSQPDPSTPQQKSDKNPPRDRSQVHGGSMFAVLMPATFPASTIATLTRSPR